MGKLDRWRFRTGWWVRGHTDLSAWDRVPHGTEAARSVADTKETRCGGLAARYRSRVGASRISYCRKQILKHIGQFIPFLYPTYSCS
jgi:hypothetical protein